MSRVSKHSRKYHGIQNGYRSGLEEVIAKELEERGVPVRFESIKIKYVKPSRRATYTPDFQLPNGIIIETKGRFVTSDRQKHLLIQQQHPELDIRFVFARPNQTITKTSRTTYAMWCDRNGFKWAERSIPDSWIQEPPKG